MYNLLVTSMSTSEARAALLELLNRAENGEEVTITRHGRPVAVLVRPGVTLKALYRQLSSMVPPPKRDKVTG